MDGCSDTVEVDMGDMYMQSMGRIAQMDVTIKNVCPGKRVALAVILTEVDQAGQEHARGLKTVTVPAHHAATCWSNASNLFCRRIWMFQAIRRWRCATRAI